MFIVAAHHPTPRLTDIKFTEHEAKSPRGSPARRRKAAEVAEGWAALGNTGLRQTVNERI